MFHRDDAELHVPDGTGLPGALERTTDLGIGAHPDDLEFFAIVPIGECRARPDRWFTGVTCTDGAGSAQVPGTTPLASDGLVHTRRAEQRSAAEVGGYAAMAQLGHPSSFVRSPDGFGVLVDELERVLRTTAPSNVYTHNLADKHATHVAVGLAVVAAIRRLPAETRPVRLVGCEGWRDLDWLPDDEKVRFDATPYSDLADRLAAVYASQIVGAKRYDRASRGRRWANATLFEPRAVDDAEEVVVAMDLTALVRNDDLDPGTYVLAAIDRFRREVGAEIERYRTS